MFRRISGEPGPRSEEPSRSASSSWRSSGFVPSPGDDSSVPSRGIRCPCDRQRVPQSKMDMNPVFPYPQGTSSGSFQVVDKA